MNNLSKTIMTIAVAGSLLFGTIATTSAEFGKTIGTERQQTNPRVNPLDDFLNDPFGGDGDPDPLVCLVKGKISYLSAHFSTGISQIEISSVEENKTYYFHIYPTNNPHQWDILQAAWLHNLTLKIQNDTTCSGAQSNIGDLVHTLSVRPDLTEQ